MFSIPVDRTSATSASRAFVRESSVTTSKHYTDQPSELRSSCDVRSPVALFHAGGFLTTDMLGATFEQWHHVDVMPTGLLIDLRNVAGYESGCAHLAYEFLRSAARRGVRRVAFLAASTVLRTAATMASLDCDVRVRFFADERSAHRWLQGGSQALIAAPRE